MKIHELREALTEPDQASPSTESAYHPHPFILPFKNPSGLGFMKLNHPEHVMNTCMGGPVRSGKNYVLRFHGNVIAERNDAVEFVDWLYLVGWNLHRAEDADIFKQLTAGRCVTQGRALLPFNVRRSRGPKWEWMATVTAP